MFETIVVFTYVYSEPSTCKVFLALLYHINTRKYMHAETLALLTKTIVFSEHEVSKVVVMVTR
jgi:hypothetical protein